METNRRDITKLKAQLRELTEKLEEVSQSAVETAGSSTQNALADARERLEDIVEQVQTQGKALQKKVGDVSKEANNYAHENPWHVVAAGAALGLLAGIIISNRKGR